MSTPGCRAEIAPGVVTAAGPLGRSFVRLPRAALALGQ